MITTSRTQSMVLALAGPAAAGAAAGFRSGLVELVRLGAAMPAVTFGVAAVTLPALYVATTYTGTAPALEKLFDAVLRALRDAGIALLGLAPALLFLAATSTVDMARAWTGVAFAGGAFAAIRVLSRGALVGTNHSFTQRGVFAAWAVLAAAIGGIVVARVLFPDPA